MIRPEDHIPIPYLLACFPQPLAFGHTDGDTPSINDAQRTGSVERDPFDLGRRDARGGEDAVTAEGEGGPDVLGGLFVDPVIGL